MTHFGEILKEARIRARLTQQELAKKVGIHHSYISKMEKEDYLPSFDVAEKLAEALGINNDEGKYLEFLNAAENLKLKGFKLVKVEDEAEGEEVDSLVSAAIVISNSSLVTTGEEVDDMMVSANLSKEEYTQVDAAVKEMTKRLLLLIETERKIRKEG